MEVWLWMSLVSWNDYHLKLEGTLEVSPCRWLPVCCPWSQLRGLATGRVLDFSSGRCQGRGDSQSLSQGRDSRHPGSSCVYHLCIDMQMMSEWMNEWMNETAVAGPIHSRPWLWVGGGNQRISLRASQRRKVSASRRGTLWGWWEGFFFLKNLDLMVIPYWCI